MLWWRRVSYLGFMSWELKNRLKILFLKDLWIANSPFWRIDFFDNSFLLKMQLYFTKMYAHNFS